MPTPNQGGWKTCSRGHKYRGSGPCPICWPGRAVRDKYPARPARVRVADSRDSRDVDAYLRMHAPDVRERLTTIRSIIRKIAPDATEKISYRMPAFFLNGALVWFAAFKNHIGFYPGAAGVAAFKDEIKNYKSAKGSIQFPHDQPLPIALIKRIVKFRVKDNRER